MDFVGVVKSSLGFIIQLGILGFIFSVLYERYRESESQKDSLELFINLFKEELKDNGDFIKSGEHRLYEDTNEQAGNIRRYVKPKTGAWQLVAGSPELKYLPKEKLQKIAWAYTTIFDLNDFLDSLNYLITVGAPLGNIKPFYGVSERLHEKALKAIEEAYKSIEDFEVEHQGFLGYLYGLFKQP